MEKLKQLEHIPGTFKNTLTINNYNFKNDKQFL